MPRFHVARSIEIAAPPEKVFETVADYGTWTTWSPWLCAEPDAEVRVTDDASSVGSIYAWDGQIVGAGELEHQRLEPGRAIEDEIRFRKPFRSRSDVAFAFEPSPAGTHVTWSMDGSLPWFLFFMRRQMEAYIGMDYDRGLKMLKEWIETGEILSRTSIRGVESVGEVRMAGVRKTSPLSRLGTDMQAAFEEAREQLTRQRLPADGEPMSVYHKFDVVRQIFEYTSGYVIPASVTQLPPALSTWSTPATKALVVEHVGSYDHLGNAWSTANQYVRYHKMKCRAEPFERYINSPDDTPVAELRTEICMPLR